jgi:hypothetical protein
MSVTDLPALDVWVTSNCSACERTLRVISACETLHELVDIQVHRLDSAGAAPPAAVVGGPSIVFFGSVIALGTPDCSALTARIMSMASSRPTEDGSQ